MSEMGHSLQIHSAPVPTNVGYAPNSDRSGLECELMRGWPECAGLVTALGSPLLPASAVRIVSQSKRLTGKGLADVMGHLRHGHRQPKSTFVRYSPKATVHGLSAN